MSNLNQLIATADNMEDGPERAAVLEEAIRLADASNDIETAFELRLELVHVASFHGMDDRAVVAFGWCLAQSDRDPERFPEADLLWKYKWIVTDCFVNPAFPRKQIFSMIDDLERRYVRNGYSPRTAHHKRCYNYRVMGRKEEAAKYFELWMKMERDEMADCKWCEISHVVSYKIFLGDYEGALETAGPLLGGKKLCSTVPHSTYGTVLEPLLRLGRLDEADKYRKIGYRMISKNQQYLDDLAKYLALFGRLGKAKEGVAILEKHTVWALDSFNLDARFEFYAGAAAFLEAIPVGKQPMLAIRFPEAFAGTREDGRYDKNELAEWFSTEALKLAKQFDKRNGTRFYAETLANYRELALGK